MINFIFHTTLFPLPIDTFHRQHVVSLPATARVQTVWTPRRLKLLRDMYPDRDSRVIAISLGVTYQAVKSKATVLGLRKLNRKVWTKKDDALLRKLYPGNRTENIVVRLKCTVKQAYVRAHKLGIEKDPSFLLELNRELGRKLANNEVAIRNRIQPGHVPMNKGMRQVDYMSKEMIDRTKATRFKKGGPSINELYDGCIRLRRDVRTGRPYKYIRLAKSRWVPYHTHIWVLKRGPVPEGMVVSFKDGNSLNCKLSNMHLITMRENMLRNSIMRYPKELRSLIHLQGKLNRTINEKQNRRSA